MTDEANMEQPTTVEDPALKIGRIVAFYLGEQRYAFPIDDVREIQQIVAFSEVPSGGMGVIGMVNLRGEVIPAVDLRRLVGMPPVEYDLETPMIITDAHGHRVAIVVDEVQDVVELPAGCMQGAPPLHQLSSKMVGVARLEDGLVYILDTDQLLGAGLF